MSEQKPLSVQAKPANLEKYKKRLKLEFSEYEDIFPGLPLSTSLYSKIIYIHLQPTNADIDNISKPFVDTFKGIIYPDDNIINHRICSKIKFDDFNSYELQIDLLPDKIAKKLDFLLMEKRPHIVYYEIDKFSPDMVFFGGAKYAT